MSLKPKTAGDSRPAFPQMTDALQNLVSALSAISAGETDSATWRRLEAAVARAEQALAEPQPPRTDSEADKLWRKSMARR